MIKAIIFDLWETLGTKTISIGGTLREKLGIENTSDFLVKHEAALQLKDWSDKRSMAISYLNEFNVEVNDENIQSVIDTVDKGISLAVMFDGMKELVIALSANYRLGVLSNTSSYESPAVQKWGLPIDVEIYSWQICSLKPSIKSFEAICKKLQIDPKQVLFIDDNELNIESANEFGMTAIMYKNMDQLKQELISLRIKLN